MKGEKEDEDHREDRGVGWDGKWMRELTRGSKLKADEYFRKLYGFTGSPIHSLFSQFHPKCSLFFSLALYLKFLDPLLRQSSDAGDVTRSITTSRPLPPKSLTSPKQRTSHLRLFPSQTSRRTPEKRLSGHKPSSPEANQFWLVGSHSRRLAMESQYSTRAIEEKAIGWT